MVFELWETEAANVIGEYETEAAALAVVRDAIVRNGRDYAASWELARAWEDRETEPVAAGAALIRRALRSIPA